MSLRPAVRGELYTDIKEHVSVLAVFLMNTTCRRIMYGWCNVSISTLIIVSSFIVAVLESRLVIIVHFEASLRWPLHYPAPFGVFV